MGRVRVGELQVGEGGGGGAAAEAPWPLGRQRRGRRWGGGVGSRVNRLLTISDLKKIAQKSPKIPILWEFQTKSK